MPLGIEVRLGPGHNVLDGDPAHTRKRGTALHSNHPPLSDFTNVGFLYKPQPCLFGQMAGWIRIPLGTEVGLGQGGFALDGYPALPTERGTAAPLATFYRTLLWYGRPSQQLLSSRP